MAGAVYVMDDIDADMASGPQRFYCHICKVKIDTVTDVSIFYDFYLFREKGGGGADEGHVTSSSCRIL